jgi:hypothetical protein
MVIISECLLEMLICGFTPCSAPKISVSLRSSAYFKNLMKDIGVLVEGFEHLACCRQSHNSLLTVSALSGSSRPSNTVTPSKS